MRPAEYNVSGLTSAALTFFKSTRFTTWVSTRNGLVKPRLGSRRYIGICPPSKPGLVAPPVRALWPLWPLPEGFPRPDPGPRPTRLRAWVDPSAGDKVERVNRRSCGAAARVARDVVAVRLPAALPRFPAAPLFTLFFSAISSPAPATPR